MNLIYKNLIEKNLTKIQKLYKIKLIYEIILVYH